jgi:hypothetical protein
MAETGCLKDGYFNNLEVENTTILGGTFGLAPTGQSFGIYEGAFELNFRSPAITGTDNGLVKTVATLPANCRIIDVYMLTTEAFNSDDEKGFDLVVTSTTPASADTEIAGGVVQVITTAEYKSSSSGALNSFKSAEWHSAGTDGTSIKSSGTGTHLVLINTDGNNTVHTITSGKVVVYIKYMGNGPPVANTSV